MEYPINHVKTTNSYRPISFRLISVDSKFEYRNMQKLLTQGKVHYRIFLFENEKKLKFVLRGLPANTPMHFIEKILLHDERHGSTVTQLYRGNTRNCALLPLLSEAIVMGIFI